MKLKKLLAFGLALVMCLAMAACGANPDEKQIGRASCRERV